MKELDLRDLDAFVAVARTRNFRRAALEQRVSVSSLSQRLRDMEERLGVRLMNRTTRSFALTEAGELLLARVGPAMHDVCEALDRVAGLAGRAVRATADQCAAAGDRSGIGADGRSVHGSLSADPPRDYRREFVRRYRRAGVRRRRSLRRASGAGYDRGPAQPTAALRGGGLARLCRAAWQAEAPQGPARSPLHPHPLRQRRAFGLGVREGRTGGEGIACAKIDRELSWSRATRRA